MTFYRKIEIVFTEYPGVICDGHRRITPELEKFIFYDETKMILSKEDADCALRMYSQDRTSKYRHLLYQIKEFNNRVDYKIRFAFIDSQKGYSRNPHIDIKMEFDQEISGFPGLIRLIYSNRSINYVDCRFSFDKNGRACKLYEETQDINKNSCYGSRKKIFLYYKLTDFKLLLTSMKDFKKK